MTARYALYAAPHPDDPLWAFGSATLGWDAARARDAAFPRGAPFNRADWAALTEQPRRYGFHGTLKAPFELAPGVDEAGLMEAAMVFADRRPAIDIPLKVARLTRFAAFVPATPNAALHAFAADCVEAFEPFRAPLTDADMARRLKTPLSERQKSLLAAYGYPYVLEEFRYHMTLTGALPEAEADAIAAALGARAPKSLAFRLDALVVFKQASRDQRFVVLARFPMEG